ncbi:hypothetical protein [Arthrobacter caoxuetaonis]|uniref:Uncharacterized protein n=1 Tax=Arthrobacter caoxuetaonis TaxID=2886935 RepID=A0A9X1SDN7_9MICC|nr:hypothetical protein [Arthrobacter caoxuetaonis]MCC3299368.1 hypothetical protein [Arthrobacter caoxuetaonis]USQ59139.1 hypothetical protein NF551_18710 [Arthrobacter caoxuetaonis]
MTIIDLSTSGDLREFTLEVSAHADISRGNLDPRPTLIQARAARTPDGYTSADTRVLSEEFTWTTILSFTDDLAAVPAARPGEEFPGTLARYGQELIDRTIRIISL